MGKTKNNTTATEVDVTPILDPLAEGIVVDDFSEEVIVQDKEEE